MLSGFWLVEILGLICWWVNQPSLKSSNTGRQSCMFLFGSWVIRLQYFDTFGSNFIPAFSLRSLRFSCGVRNMKLHGQCLLQLNISKWPFKYRGFYAYLTKILFTEGQTRLWNLARSTTLGLESGQEYLTWVAREMVILYSSWETIFTLVVAWTALIISTLWKCTTHKAIHGFLALAWNIQGGMQ